MADVKELNKWLETFGKHIDGRPIYRLIFSTQATEIRRGEFEDVAMVPREDGTVAEIFLGASERTAKDLKYPADPDRWVLEKLIFCPENPELPETPGYFYEPLHIFKDKDGNYLPPERFALEYLMFAQQQPRGGLKKWLERYAEQEQKQRREQLAKALGIDTEPSAVEASFAFKEAVALPGKTWN